jgi:anti-sigma regulatory factor (Ser/Thr protein kinase)
MRFHLPTHATPHAFGAFLSGLDLSDPTSLQITMANNYVNVHPAALAFVAAAGLTVTGTTSGTFRNDGSFRYLDRMGLFRVLDLDPGIEQQEHDPSGRFIPLTVIRSKTDLDAAAAELIPLLHADPEKALPIRYVFSELVRNVIEHAASPVGAVVCAQYYPNKGTVGIGVADAGMGIQRSMAASHTVANAAGAIKLAMRPGVSGTSARPGGSEFNAGAGLFFSKSLARLTRNAFVVYSGDAMFKLTKGSGAQTPKLFVDPESDPHRLWTAADGLPDWEGTVVAIDLAVDNSIEFDELLTEIGAAYDIGLRLRRRRYYKTPRFI